MNSNEIGTGSKKQRSSGILLNLERFAIPLLLVLLVAIFALSPATGGSFTSAANMRNLLSNQSVTGIIALAMIVPLITGKFDLSIPAIAGVTNVTVAALIATYGLPVPVGIFIGMLVALAIGVINGYLVAYVGLNPFITTLGMYVLLGGLLQMYTKGSVISSGMPPELGAWGAGSWLGVPRPFWILLIVALLLWVLLTQTPFGRRLAAIGSNEGAAKLAGIRVNRAVFLAFLIGALLAGIAGVLLTIRSASGDATSGSSYLFPALAAVFLGQTAINPGYYNVWGTVIGVFFVAVAVNGFTMMGAASWVSQVFNGGALVASILVSTLLARVRANRAKQAQNQAIVEAGNAHVMQR